MHCGCTPVYLAPTCCLPTAAVGPHPCCCQHPHSTLPTPGSACTPVPAAGGTPYTASPRLNLPSLAGGSTLTQAAGHLAAGCPTDSASLGWTCSLWQAGQLPSCRPLTGCRWHCHSLWPLSLCLRPCSHYPVVCYTHSTGQHQLDLCCKAALLGGL